MHYLDSNVFVYAALYDGPKAAGREPAATASLTVDEVVWILSQEADRGVALEQGERLLSVPNLSVLDVTAQTMLGVLRHMDAYDHLTPRDATHLAAMIDHGVFTVVSDDADFDRVDEVERQPLDAPSG